MAITAGNNRPDLATHVRRHCELVHRTADKQPSVSVIIPVLDERCTIDRLVERVLALPFSKEALIIDDGSTDGTTERINALAGRPEVVAVFHSQNRGKGSALRSGLSRARGKIVVIQDADLEYDPADIERLIAPILSETADVVFGNRFTATTKSGWPFVRRAANHFLTWLSNRSTGLRLSDMETCYKAMRREVADALLIRENRFGVEPELTAKVARGGWRVVEIPISYSPRDYASGKKIGFRDGLRALWCILRYSRWD